MKNLFKSFLVAFLLASSFVCAYAAEITITGIQGTVEYRLSSVAEWKPATVGMGLWEGGSIRTASGSRASIKFPNKSIIWLKENTDLAIKENQPRSNQMEVENGEIKFRVPHLKWKEKFNINSGKTVASVRGTEGVVAHDTLNVLFGEVDIFIREEDGKLKFEAKVPQGTKYTGEIQLTTPSEELAGLIKWDADPNLTAQQRLDHLFKKQQDRQDVREFANKTDSENKALTEDNSRLKFTDFETGKSFRDIHGNLVLVKQELTRPTAKTIEVVNVVHRKGDYLHSRSHSSTFDGTVYNGGAVNSRMDAFLTKVEFSQDLPDKINDLPGFFEKYPNVKVNRVQIVFANSTDFGNVFTMGFFGKRPDTSDEISPENLYIGTLISDTSLNGLTGNQKLLNLFSIQDYENGDSISGLTRFVPDKDSSVTRTWLTLEDAGSSQSLRNRIVTDGTNGELYSRDSRRWKQAANGNQKLWIVGEKYAFAQVKDGSPGIRNASDFAKIDSSIMSQSAFQMVLSAKEHDSTNNTPKSTDAQNFSGGNVTTSNGKNIDVVFTPDIMLGFVSSGGTKTIQKIRVNPPF